MNIDGLESTTEFVSHLVEHENNKDFKSKTPQTSYVKKEILAYNDNDNINHLYFTDAIYTNDMYKNGCVIQTREDTTFNNLKTLVNSTEEKSENLNNCKTFKLDYTNNIDNYYCTVKIKKEPEELDNYKILELDESVTKEEYLSSNKFEVEIEYDDKTLKIKKEIYGEYAFDNSEIYQTLKEKEVVNKSNLANSTKPIFNKYVNCDRKVTAQNKNNHKKLVYTCDICHQTLNNKQMLVIHIKQHMNNTMVNECFSKKVSKNESSKKRTNVQCVRPKKVNNENNLYECEVCLKRFSDYSNCRRHIHKHYPSANIKGRFYKCHICKKIQNRADNLKVHMRIHTQDKPFKCDSCSLTFHRNDTMQMHKKIHEPNQKQMLKKRCNECCISFYSNATLVRHIKTIHKNTNLYLCYYCQKTYSRKDMLKMHIRSKHTGERPYHCHVCAKSFFEKSVLNRHEKIHKKSKIKI